MQKSSFSDYVLAFRIILSVLTLLLARILFMIGIIFVIIKVPTINNVVEHVEIYERIKEDTKIVEYTEIQKETSDRVFINAYTKRDLYNYSYSIYVYRETDYKENLISWDYNVFNVEDELSKLKSTNPDKNYIIKIHLSDAKNDKIVKTVSSSYVNTYIQNRKDGMEIKTIKLFGNNVDENSIKWKKK